jgi:hypothetical protein
MTAQLTSLAMCAGKEAPTRRVLSRLRQSLIAAGLVALLVLSPSAPAESSGVVLNEVNCTGTDWVEVVNGSNAAVSLAGWVLTDDALDRVPLRDSHRMRFGADAVLGSGGRLVIRSGTEGFAFGLSCGDDTLRLADATGTLVDAVTLPVLATAGLTYGRIPDGTGDWTWTLPTEGTANAVAPDTRADDPAWLYDPMQVTEIDLEAGAAALSQLAAVPDEYVDARITLRNGESTYGPYMVGMRLKGQTSFRTLEGKAAFKIKFGHTVAGQSFFGLKGLTLNNMVEDPSMIAEASASLLLQATGVPTARVGYAYVRLNGTEYGLYANVENVDAVMARRWFTGTQHIYEGDTPGVDMIPGRADDLEVDEGSSSDRSDLEALSAANAGGADGWWERMQPVADLVEMTRAFAAEHYIGHSDGYSVAAGASKPNNYYLHSDAAGRFVLIVSGTDQTWLERSEFGAYGDGVLMRGCVANGTCRRLYVDALRRLAASATVAALPATARAIRDVIAPWRVRDPSREHSVDYGEAQADAKIATMDARPEELAAWLADPSFVDAQLDPSNDLSVTGTVTPASSPVGGSHVWRLQVKNTGGGTASGVVLDVQLSTNVVYAFSQVARGAGFELTAAGLHSDLGVLASDSPNDVVIVTNVTHLGEVSLTATASFADPDPTPADNTLVLKASTSAVVTSPLTPPVVKSPVVVRPVLGKAAVLPAKPLAGKRFTFSLPVTRSDTRAPLLTGKLVCDPAVASKGIKHAESFKAGKAQLSFVIPTTAKGKVLKVKIKILALGQSASHTYVYTVR